MSDLVLVELGLIWTYPNSIECGSIPSQMNVSLFRLRLT